MDFFNIGPFELILVLILGFLFFGPDKLPGMAAKAGKLYRDFRKATFDMSKTISEEISRETKLEKETKTISPPNSVEKINSAATQPTTNPPKSDEIPHD